MPDKVNAQITDAVSRGPSEAEKPIGLEFGADGLADPTAAIVQDIRSFLQSMEMIMVPAAVRALSESLESGGTEILVLVNTIERLANFAGEIVAVADTRPDALPMTASPEER